MKHMEQECPVILSRNLDNTFYVNGNGNHRVLSYKIMMLAEIAQNYKWVYEDDYDMTFNDFDDITKKYWLYAHITNN